MKKDRSEILSETHIDGYKCLRDYIGNKSYEQLSEYEKNIKAKFSIKLKEIQCFHCPYCPADKDGFALSPGEQLLLINKNFGYTWNTIPYEKMETVKEWMQNNHHKIHLILHKDYHYGIENMPNDSGAIEYKNWYRNHEQNN